ncbi:hypothetical protein HPP92_026256 [Vanilla planifolia]|uniref:C2 domain-containing protein n=1 Tax=Vanilla planifolia TaxID=51239 RepID=A0A835PFW0_VANPL|nr:hypothetical protein HPP92_026256 [Vanilla planifolia]
MAYRTLELTLISAKDLNDVNLISKMDVYAVVTIAGDHRTKQRTPTDHDGGKNPSWNSTLRFPVPVEPSAASQLVIHVLLRSERALGDRDVGEVHIPLKELLDSHKDGSKFVSYQVRKPSSGKAKGVINLSYKLVDLPVASGAPPPSAPMHVDAVPTYPPPGGKPIDAVPTYPPPGDKPVGAIPVYPPPGGKPVGAAPTYPHLVPGKASKDEDPVVAYPASGASGSTYPPSYPPPGGYPSYPPQGAYPAYPPPSHAGYGYGATPQGGYGYGAPPPAGYGYGAPPAGYGYAAAPQKKKNNFGMGLGAGLLGGALGGLLIGDMVSDAGAYDAGYDAGFGDGLDF